MPRSRRNLLLLILAWTAVGILIVSYLAGRGGESGGVADYPAPAFELVNQDGRTVSSDELQGQVALVAFIYTRCPDVCQLITYEMTQVQAALKDRGWFGDGVRLASISFDPEHDTPDVLRAYAGHMGADLSGWDFLTGPSDTIAGVVRDFGIYVERHEPHGPSVAGSDHVAQGHDHGEGVPVYTHTAATLLVGPDGMVREVYTGTEFDVDRIVADVAGMLPLSWWERLFT